jgi:voltage-gated potassium channel
LVARRRAGGVESRGRGRAQRADPAALRVADAGGGAAVIPVIVVEETSPGQPWETAATVANWAIWLLFLAEVVTMLAVVPSRRAWLRNHVLDVAIVALTPPVLPAGMQAARIFRLARLLRLARGFVAMRRLFTREGVRYAAITTVFLVLIAGAAFAAIEKEQHLSAWDGIYWAISTVTTVGYGDITPTTDGGRVIAAAVMITGIGFVAVITGAVAERFLAAELAELRARVERLEA